MLLPMLTLILTVISIRKTASECHSYGCPLTAVDMASEGQEKEALNFLRLGNIGTDDESTFMEQQQRALSILQTTGDDSSLALTLRGYKGGDPDTQINQDRALLIRPFRIFAEEKSTEKEHGLLSQLLGVFDGHGPGGERTSQHALEQVPKLLAEKLAALAGDDLTQLPYQQDAIQTALTEVFLEVNQTDPTKGKGGCTASVILQLGSKLYIANAGDSISFVGVYFGTSNNVDDVDGKKKPAQKGKVQIVYETREDKPDLPDERARIVAAGGYVNMPSNSEGDVPRAYHVDQDGRMLWGLAMSRSLGDWSVQGVIAEPIVDVLDVRDIVQAVLTTHEETCRVSIETYTEDDNDIEKYCEALDPRNVHIFCVSATDGMMDELPPDFIGSVLAPAFFDPFVHVHTLTAAERLILESAKGWNRLYNGSYRDDIAIAAATIILDDSILSHRQGSR
jgi:hypothetical protein